MKPLTIFLGDLTYDTVSLSTDSNPLNIGYVAAYSKKLLGTDVDIRLFKYISDLEEALYVSRPDVLGLSNYCWCERISLELFDLAKTLNPDVITVWGGPNFPTDREAQTTYLENRQAVDFYLPMEGEIPFYNLVQKLFESLGSANGVASIKDEPIPGCVTNTRGNVMFGSSVNRLKSLDEIPSPYLEGLLDPFFDGRLKPRVQTSRGCPFSCTFCVDGSSAVNKVHRFSLERIKEELLYIAENVPPETETLGISDLNFGMNSRDLDISDAIVELQDRFGYPRKVMMQTGKNSKEKIIKTVRKLSNSIDLLMSVQSMDDQVLENVGRKNISKEQMIALAPTIREANLRTASEVIVGLPGSTYESDVETLRTLVNAGMDRVEAYTLMLLNGAPLTAKKERMRWEFLTKYRILPRDFVELQSGKKVLEIEEVVVGSNTLSFLEYIELRKLALLVFSVTHGVVFDPILKYIRLHKLEPFQLPYRMLQKLPALGGALPEAIESFGKDTADELWDSAEDIETYYQDSDAYQRLLDGKEGFNVIQVHHANIVATHMTEILHLASNVVKELLEEAKLLNKDNQAQFDEIISYCAGLSYNILSIDENQPNPEATLTYDISSWIKSSVETPLSAFTFEEPVTAIFDRKSENVQTIKKQLEIYGNTKIGRAQALKRIQVTNIWRNPSLHP